MACNVMSKDNKLIRIHGGHIPTNNYATMINITKTFLGQGRHTLNPKVITGHMYRSFLLAPEPEERSLDSGIPEVKKSDNNSIY